SGGASGDGDGSGWVRVHEREIWRIDPILAAGTKHAPATDWSHGLGPPRAAPSRRTPRAARAPEGVGPPHRRAPPPCVRGAGGAPPAQRPPGPRRASRAHVTPPLDRSTRLEDPFHGP